MFAFGGGKLELAVAGHQLEWVTAPVALHIAPASTSSLMIRSRLPASLFLRYVSVNSELRSRSYCTHRCLEEAPR
ncbi:hypothetical protein I548_4345 [Mycobacterium intracellulare]|nr:hypothetical protein I548_4345 [Mycobacterium intracellulare]